MLAAGTILDGRYEIIEPIAEGGMGAVFRARRKLLGDEVALKIVRSEFARDQGARERFLRESRACAQLHHPNIVSIFDYNLDAEGRPFLVMELLNGPSLREELASRGSLPLVLIYRVMGKMFAILSVRGSESVILKSDPHLVEILRAQYAGVGHRSHLDRRFWISVDLDADVPPGEVERLALSSYALVCAGLTRKQRA